MLLFDLTLNGLISDGFQSCCMILFLKMMFLCSHGAEVCNLPQHYFYGAHNRYLQGFKYGSVSALSPIRCVRNCHADLNCKSVNFLTNEHLCELNNPSRIQEDCPQFKNLTASVYFDADENTPDFTVHPGAKPRSCKEHLRAGNCENGIYPIYPFGANVDGIRVFCDMETDGGGWIVVQRREDGSTDFHRNWDEYRRGFGILSREFWLGNDNLKNLTESMGTWQLRVDMEDWDNKTAFSQYDEFLVSGEKYRLYVGSYNGQSTGGDGLTIAHNNMDFSTKDRDNDVDSIIHCADDGYGGWWYSACYYCNLNGKYINGYALKSDKGIFWSSWLSWTYYKKCSMKIREK